MTVIRLDQQTDLLRTTSQEPLINRGLAIHKQNIPTIDQWGFSPNYDIVIADPVSLARAEYQTLNELQRQRYDQIFEQIRLTMLTSTCNLGDGNNLKLVSFMTSEGQIQKIRWQLTLEDEEGLQSKNIVNPVNYIRPSNQPETKYELERLEDISATIKNELDKIFTSLVLPLRDKAKNLGLI